MSYILKDPAANLDYVWDWSDWLATGETITDHAVTATGATVGVTSIIETDTAVRAWISGGTLGATIEAVCRITTSAGRIDERTIQLRIIDR